MAKYNIQPKKEKMARYQTLLSEETKDRLHDDILRMLVSEQKYKDPAYNSRRLAEDLGTNSRYISAVCATRFPIGPAPITVIFIPFTSPICFTP